MQFFMRATVHHTERGMREVDIPSRQPSFMVSPFVDTNAWAVIPEGVSVLKVGDVVEICQ